MCCNRNNDDHNNNNKNNKNKEKKKKKKKNIYHLLYIPQTLNNSLSSYKNYSQSGDSRSNCDIDST